MQQYFKSNNSDELIVLLNGWGTDERPFLPLTCDKDLLVLSDYTTIPNSIDFDFSKYNKKILVSFSAGVAMAAFLKDILPEFDYKVAVNGTLSPLDSQIGIPASVLAEMKGVTLDNAMELRKKVFDNQEHLDLFNQNQPLRSIDSCVQEILILEKMLKDKKFDFKYDKVIIGKNDKIVPCELQKISWRNNGNGAKIVEMSGGHFLFYLFNSFEEILEGLI